MFHHFFRLRRLMLPFHNKRRGLSQPQGPLAKPCNSRLRYGAKFIRRSTSAIRSEQTDKRLLSGPAVLSHTFANFTLAAFYIQEIVADLECGAERRAKRFQTCENIVLCVPEYSGCTATETDQGPSLAPLHVPDIRLFGQGMQIHDLPANHTNFARRLRQAENERCTNSSIGMGRGFREDFKRKCLQSIANQYGHSLVICAMDGGQATPYFIRIHRGKVIMYQRICVQTFD